MKEVVQMKYLGAVLCMYGSMEREVRQETVKGRKVIHALECHEGKCKYRRKRHKKHNFPPNIVICIKNRSTPYPPQ